MSNLDLVWLVIGFLPATFFLWLAWFTGEDITVKGLIIYLFAVMAGPITLAIFFFFLYLAIDWSRIWQDDLKEWSVKFLNKIIIKGKV